MPAGPVKKSLKIKHLETLGARFCRQPGSLDGVNVNLASEPVIEGGRPPASDKGIERLTLSPCF
jgi:hypothetical protein